MIYANSTHLDNQADVIVSSFLEIAQGTSFELKIEQSQYSFYLNETVIKQIQLAQKTGYSLYIPPKLLVPLWYCASFSTHLDMQGEESEIVIKQIRNFDVVFIVNILRLFLRKSLQDKTTLQCGLTFNSYYKQDTSASVDYKDQDIVLQSTIILNGDIFHKIRKDFLQNSNCSIIVSAHYWLTDQLLSYLRTNLNLLAWELISLFPAGFLAWKLYLVKSVGVFLSIFVWLGIFIVFATIRYLLVNQLQKRTSINSEYINWLVWGVTCLTPSIFLNYIDFLLLLFLSLIGPLLKRVFSFILLQVGKRIMRWVLSS
ncbi:hypothetical protein FNW02_19870 [Komarekiella sp. 'clone 1']|uniref:Uncharacterized protein n=1 Tax=Komarekiella delphini-convector SJRDD-AB1 TaxID=2593771 RepID=A0AA40SZN2_9NOST|nr:hypothetical protein [Komarekiella delphini-convector]MBD6618020.1 hypothetical protein [Komarekiella delphini-convector SJRDD-AB1]